MKAKYVKESINFEREIDPKESMGIGMREKMKEEMEKDSLFKYENDFDAFKWAVDLGYTKYAKFLLDAGIKKYSKDSFFLDWAVSNNDAPMIKLLIDYGWKPSKDMLRKSFDLGLQYSLEALKPYFSKEDIDSSEWQHSKMVPESYNFERGKDPKEAMGIGIPKFFKMNFASYPGEEKNAIIKLLGEKEDDIFLLVHSAAPFNAGYIDEVSNFILESTSIDNIELNLSADKDYTVVLDLYKTDIGKIVWRESNFSFSAFGNFDIFSKLKVRENFLG